MSLPLGSLELSKSHLRGQQIWWSFSLFTTSKLLSFPNPMTWLNFPSGRLYFYKSFLVCGYLPRPALSRFFPWLYWDQVEQVCRLYWIHSLYQEFSIFRNTERQEYSCIPWHMALGLTAPTEALLLMDGCLISCLRRRKERRNILHCPDGDVTLLGYSLTEMVSLVMIIFHIL